MTWTRSAPPRPAALAALVALAAGATAQCEIATVAPPGLVGDEGFPSAIARDGERLAVGARFDDAFAEDAGVVNVFQRQGRRWEHVTKLFGSGVGAFDAFGSAVAVEGDRIVAGCHQCQVEFFIDGAAFVFEYDGRAWSEVADLRQSLPDARDQFGIAVDLEGDTIVVGALADWALSPGPQLLGEGVVYVFEQQAGEWVETQRLFASDRISDGRFGASLDLDGDRLLIGASSNNGNTPGVRAGAVYVFERTAGVWSETAKLAPAGLGSFDSFGAVVELEGDTAVISAPGVNDDGVVYVYEHDGLAWSEVACFDHTDPTEIVNYGNAIALEGDRFVVTENRFGPVGGNALFLYERDGSGWSEVDAYPATQRLAALASEGDELAVGIFAPGANPVSILALPPLVNLAAAPSSLSLVGGGGVQLEVDFGPCDAGDTYWIVGSASGSVPGAQIGERPLPLVLDAYSAFTLARPNREPLANGRGVLDADGVGRATLTLPGGLGPGLEGLVLRYAALVIDSTTLELTRVSDVAEVELVR